MKDSRETRDVVKEEVEGDKEEDETEERKNAVATTRNVSYLVSLCNVSCQAQHSLSPKSDNFSLSTPIRQTAEEAQLQPVLT